MISKYVLIVDGLLHCLAFFPLPLFTALCVSGEAVGARKVNILLKNIGSRIKVGIVDTGALANHPCLGRDCSRQSIM